MTGASPLSWRHLTRGPHRSTGHVQGAFGAVKKTKEVSTVSEDPVVIKPPLRSPSPAVLRGLSGKGGQEVRTVVFNRSPLGPKPVRKVVRVWPNEPPATCGLPVCGRKIRSVFVHGLVQQQPGWHIMCPGCSAVHGVGFGEDRGHQYERSLQTGKFLCWK